MDRYAHHVWQLDGEEKITNCCPGDVGTECSSQATSYFQWQVKLHQHSQTADPRAFNPTGELEDCIGRSMGTGIMNRWLLAPGTQVEVVHGELAYRG